MSDAKEFFSRLSRLRKIYECKECGSHFKSESEGIQHNCEKNQDKGEDKQLTL